MTTPYSVACLLTHPRLNGDCVSFRATHGSADIEVTSSSMRLDEPMEFCVKIPMAVLVARQDISGDWVFPDGPDSPNGSPVYVEPAGGTGGPVENRGMKIRYFYFRMVTLSQTQLSAPWPALTGSYIAACPVVHGPVVDPVDEDG